MGSSLLTRFAITFFAVVLSLVLWESTVSWARYVSADQDLGGFTVVRDEVRLRAPGAVDDDALALPRRRFRGLGYAQLQPRWPLSLAVGETRRVRLVKVFMIDDEGLLQASSYGGGLDPLARYLHMTRLLSASIAPRIDVQLIDLALEVPPTRSLRATRTATAISLE